MTSSAAPPTDANRGPRPGAGAAPPATPPATPLPGPIARWVLAARPRTLTAAFAPVAIGGATAYATGLFDAWPFLLAMLGAFAIQIGTNFANDYYDFVKGADTEERLGPVRVTQAGLIPPARVRAAMFLTFGFAMLTGSLLVAHAGWPVVWIGLASVASGIAYTGGPFPLAYNGLGDVFVFIFFGIVAVMGTHYVQTFEWSSWALLSAAPPGALATAILAVNNLRDVDTDVKANKRTLAVRFGREFARGEYVGLLVLAWAVPLVLAVVREQPAFLLPFLALPVAFPLVRSVFRDAGAPLNETLAGTAKLLAIHSVLFAAAWVVDGATGA